MKNSQEPSLEQQVGLALRQLPLRRAPATLTPRVLAAIAVRNQRAWWHEPCWSWPFPLQLGVILFFLFGLCALAWLGSNAGFSVWMSSSSSGLMQLVGNLIGLGRGLVSLIDAGLLVVGALARPWLMVAVGIVFLMYLSCLGVGAIFLRVAYRRL